jgi:hypothetical protein
VGRRAHPQEGPLGEFYPQPCCIIEGDTPSFLSLMNNGLVSYMNPTFGGMGRPLRAAATVVGNGVAHVILAVTDSGVPALTSYRRVILTIKAGA